MLDSMEKVNAKKEEPPHKTHHPHQVWTELIRTLQAMPPQVKNVS